MISAQAQTKLPVQNEYTIYQLRLPNTGFLEVKLTPTTYTTRAMLEFEEFPDVKYLDIDQTKTFTITKSQVLYFQLINEPTNNKAFYTTIYSPNSGFNTNTQGWQTDTWDYSPAGGGVLQFRYRYVALQSPPSGPPPQPTRPPVIACASDEGPYHGPFTRGFCSTDYCGNMPESWVRGRADLDTKTGQIAMLLELETDSTAGGPKGMMQAVFKDAAGKTLATVSSKEQGVGGKSPGHSRIENIPASANMQPDLAKQVNSIEVMAKCTGHVDKWFNLIPGDLKLDFSIKF